MWFLASSGLRMGFVTLRVPLVKFQVNPIFPSTRLISRRNLMYASLQLSNLDYGRLLTQSGYLGGLTDTRGFPHKLLERLEVNFHHYGATPNYNQLLAMACNPLTASLGMIELKVHANFITKNSANASSKHIAKMDHRQKIKAVLLETMRKALAAVQAEAEEEAEVDSTEAASEEAPRSTKLPWLPRLMTPWPTTMRSSKECRHQPTTWWRTFLRRN